MRDYSLNTRPWLISCDESGTDGARYYGFGSLWMSWDRRGDFLSDLRDIGAKNGIHGLGEDEGAHEFKWSKVKPQKLAFYTAVIDYFFARRWLSFHALVVQRATVSREFHRDFDEARRKHFTMLLGDNIKRVARKHPGRTEFRAWVDPIASRYQKADEAVEVIGNNIIRKLNSNSPPTLKVTTRTSHGTPSIQLCDLLLGAVMAAWQGKVESGGKLAVMKCIAKHLDWSDLKADTHVAEPKFNVWFFHDPTKGPREVTSRRTPFHPPAAPRSGSG
jgi:hypothetical protein